MNIQSTPTETTIKIDEITIKIDEITIKINEKTRYADRNNNNNR